MRRVLPALAYALALVAAATSTAAAASAATPFTYLDYAAISRRLSALAAAHPAYLRLESAQTRFGVPAVGDCGGDGCVTWVATVTDLAGLPADPGRAEVLVSGEVHGDEVVGVHAVLAWIELVLSRAAAGDEYFLRMLRTRVVVALPMANTVGFYRGERGERQVGGAVIDPNRDFAFDQDPKKCMQTVAARVINEIVRDGLIRVLLTFHGGTNVIGYEWGDMTHCKGRVCQPAPDEYFMHALGVRMSEVAGGGAYESKYPVGNMGKLVYPVHGGMEDWAYGASWSGLAVQCRPETLGGYAPEKTVYSKGSNRIVTYLVETAMQKKPAEETLGDDSNMLTTGGAGDGHVPRNVRLIVAAVDAVEPYVVLANATREGNGTEAVVRWAVGGAFFVNGTYLQWSDEKGIGHGTSDVFNGAAAVPVLSGSGAATEFRARLPALPLTAGALYVRVAAVVDAQFANTPPGASPDVPVQTHVVASRLDPTWQYSSGDKVVRGHQVMYSDTLRVELDSASGRVRFARAREKDWRKDGLRAPEDAKVAATLLGRDAGQIEGGTDEVGVRGAGEKGVGVTGMTGKRPKMDPRDRDAVVSGIIGVAALLMITGLVVASLWQHHQQRRRDAEAVYTISEEEELKAPLHGEGDIVEDPTVAMATVAGA